MRHLFHLAFILLFSTLGFGQNLNKVDALYLKEGGQILTEFNSFDTIYKPREYKLKFFKNLKTKFYCYGKKRCPYGRVKSRTKKNKYIIIKYVNSYDRLTKADKEFFEELNRRTREAKNGKDLFYKISNYWLLPVQSARTTTDLSDLKKKDGWGIEQRLDEVVLIFLVNNGHFEKFKNFEHLARTAKATSKEFMGPEVKSEMLDKFKARLESYTDLMYVRSKSMLAFIEQL